MVEGQRITVEPGSVFFTLPWELHGGVDAPQPATALWFAVILLDRGYDRRPAALAFNPALGLSAADARQLSQAFLGATARCLPAADRLRWLAPELVAELNARAAGRAAAVAGLIKLPLVELARCIAVAEHAPALPTSPAAQRVRAFLATLSAESAATWGGRNSPRCSRR